MVNLYVFDNLRSGGGKSVGLNYLKKIIVEDTSAFFMLPNDEDYLEIAKSHSSAKKFIIIDNPRKYRVNIFKILEISKFIKQNKIKKIVNFTNMPLIIPRVYQILMIHKAQLLLPIKNDYIQYNFFEKLKMSLDKFFLSLCLNTKIVKHIIVQTNFMKNELLKSYDFKGDISIIPSGYDSIDTNKIIFENPYNLSSNFKFFVPTSDAKHKNIEYIIEVTKKAKKENMKIEFHVTLSEDSEFGATVKQEKLTDYIIFYNQIDYFKIHNYYKSSDGVFLPTFLESFCLPYVEGISTKKNILTSDRPFAREICKEAGWYFDPLDAKSGIKVIKEYIEFIKKTPNQSNMPKIYSWKESYEMLRWIINKY
ncbi:Glycosyl transferases group 1 [Jeotgalicoccus saudimassiliensis]|uniref:Glycosyl transferases group 1 n=1 Tax=Jeotgalicoccus saudimassiliensis TaxID=1461582 RepID=A0A078M2I8_9STAP|nr:glycosyltransferase [Jeotgalicoccus saudimassiliensis]CEA00454.1 Glycosyl transferases group 1 [Jeotgalicoccus saudimassiliensis]